MTEQSVVVVGGGFKGIIAAYLLSRTGRNVTLVDQGKGLGGILNSGEWDDFSIDYGVQFLGVSKGFEHMITETSSTEMRKLDFNYGTYTEGHRADGLAIPNFDYLGEAEQNRALREILNICMIEHKEPDSLSDLFHSKYGNTIGSKLAAFSRNFLGISAAELEPISLKATPYTRVGLLPVELSNYLKQLPELDQRLAVPRSFMSDFGDTLFYPRSMGARGYGVGAKEKLESMGVRIMLRTGVSSISGESSPLTVELSDGESLTADKVVWCLDLGQLEKLLTGKDSIQKYTHRVPMVFYYFKLRPEQVGEANYVQQHSESNHIFRACSNGVYSNQVDADGNTFICCEVTTKRDSQIWNDPEGHAKAIWREALSMGSVKDGDPVALKTINVPATFRVQKLGYSAQSTKVKDKADELLGEGIVHTNYEAFSRQEIINNMLSLVDTMS